MSSLLTGFGWSSNKERLGVSKTMDSTFFRMNVSSFSFPSCFTSSTSSSFSNAWMNSSVLCEPFVAY